MIDFIIGKIKQVKEKSTIVITNGIGFLIHTPQTNNFKENENIELYTYMHWNQEKGPSLFGFKEELDRTVFLMIIDCPKIGPSIAINILSQISTPQFLKIITSQNEAALSSINGIGIKKAEQIIMQLKHKVTKLIETNIIPTDAQENLAEWQNINDVLTSLNYSKPEILKTMKYLTENYSNQNYTLDQLIRYALAYLSKQKH